VQQQSFTQKLFKEEGCIAMAVQRQEKQENDYSS
jgi:hypothetical protein